jgi:hypothetical protein
MLPGTSVAQVVACFPHDRGFEGTLRLLGVLHRLDSLVSLRITGLEPRRDSPNVDNVIDAINCPQLKRLYISDSGSSIIPCLKDKLPSLEVLWIKDELWNETLAWIPPQSNYYTPHGKWRRLECISERQILFLDSRSSSQDVVHLPFVFSYAKRYGLVDPMAIASWLLHSHYLLAETRQLKGYTNRKFLNLERFSPYSLRKTIPLLQDFGYESLRMRLYPDVTLDQLPQSLRSLHLIATDRVSLAVIPNVIRTLSKLKLITIDLDVKIDYPTINTRKGYPGKWRGFEELLPPIDKSDSNSYCFTVSRHNLEVQGEWVLYRAAPFDREYGDGYPLGRNKAHIPELEGEVMDWLLLSPSLDRIKFVLTPDRGRGVCINEDLP